MTDSGALNDESFKISELFSSEVCFTGRNVVVSQHHAAFENYVTKSQVVMSRNLR